MTHRTWDRAQSRTSYRRAYDASQQALEVALRENRVKDECLEIARQALEYIKDALPGTTEMAISALDDIERRLAQLGPEEETG